MKTPAPFLLRAAFVLTVLGLAAVSASAQTASRLTNLSARAYAGSEAQTFTIGFTLAGTPDKPCLLRVIGPSLAPFGVTDALTDPALILSIDGVVQRANDNWAVDQTGASLVAEHTRAFGLVGAFPLDVASKDAAFIKSMTARGYTAQVGNAATPGTALFEVYDLFPDSGARLSNVSARAQVDPAHALIAGFAVSGTTPKKLLIRGVGPGLAAFNLTGTLANPRLELFRNATLVDRNDDWGGTAELTAAFTTAGAFALPGTTSRDAALLVTLAPGVYTAVVSGTGSETGLALVEIYEVP